MATRIQKGHLSVLIKSKLDRYSDGNLYYVMETGFESTSERTAINNALAYLAKEWKKFLRKFNSKTRREITIKVPLNVKEEAALLEKIKIKRRRTKIKTIEKKVRIKRRRTIFTIQDADERKSDLAELALLKALEESKPVIIKVKRRRTK